jgi:hypothetical protein
MDVTDGAITNDSITIATEDVIFEDDTDGDKPVGNPEAVRQFFKKDEAGLARLEMKNGDSCGDAVPAELQVFLIRYNEEDDTYSQQKLSNPGSYTLRDESTVPPGDCLIIEFDSFKDRTDRLCQQYGVRDEKRCTEFGVSSFNPELCNIREVSASGGTE